MRSQCTHGASRSRAAVRHSAACGRTRPTGVVLVIGMPRSCTVSARMVCENLSSMWPFRQRAHDARSVLFDAALEFGQNWRRDVSLLAAERLPELDQGARAAIVEDIENTRTSIEDWILIRWVAVGGSWSQADARAARAFIRGTYPWMDERNVAHAVSQGTYYAWHG